MRKIGLLSDTHGWLDENIFRHFEPCDELWHAGDLGDSQLADRLSSFRPLKAVFGNIDGQDIRSSYSECMRWDCEDVRVFMTHIGGTPPKYNPQVKKKLTEDPPQVFICGHSHILRIQFDHVNQVLFMNPGAAGNQGWHKLHTIVRFSIKGKNIQDCEVIELGKRG